MQPARDIELTSLTFRVNILTKNDEKMIDPESIQNHSRIIQEPPGHQKTSKIMN